jgi:DNA-binding transcriptional LysR family regulator
MCNNAQDMNWDNLQAFLAVARTGRISAAARRLAVEHTTIARRLATLEAELGVPLFYRTATGYVLTPHGQSAIAQAEVMESAALALGARAREGSGVIAGRVRLAMPPEFASHWVAPRLAAFHKKHPGIELQILVGTRQRDLSRGEAEIAVQSPRVRQANLVAVRIARIALSLYASKALARDARWRITSRETLREAPLLTYTSAFQMLQEARWFQTLRASVGAALETNSTHTLLAAALAGAGVAVLPRFVARWHDDLVAVSDDVATHDVLLITHPEFRRDPKVRASADFLKSIAAGAGGLC